MSKEDLEKLDVDAVDQLPQARSMLSMLKALILQLMGLIDDLRASLASKDTRIAELERAILGPKSERTPRRLRTVEPADPAAQKARQAEGQRKRKAHRAEKQALETVEVAHLLPTNCPGCQGVGPFEVLPPEVTHCVEYVPSHFVRERHVQHKARCGCGRIFCAPPPARVGDGSHYGPGLHAHAVVSKCADALPLHRQAKRFARESVRIARSTLTDLFHRSASLLVPLYLRLLALVAASDYVNADETSQPVMDEEKCRRGFIWTFISAAQRIIAYVFSKDRSGETPQRVLGQSVGLLQVDGYTGYNHVTTPKGRDRLGCLGHARRYFHKARDKCPAEAQFAFDLIRRVYEVEYKAAALGVIGSPHHLALRVAESVPLMERFKAWIEEQRPLHAPKSPLGEALRYAHNQWPCLTKFLGDPRVRLDNNISEGALRIIALGRDNFHWVGNDDAGQNLAILQTLVSTCVACDVNPQLYLTDVLVRIQTHPAAGLDDLLPMHWKPAVA